MGKNRNRKNNRRNKVNTSDNTRIMKKIMMYQDSEIILGAITDRNVISMAVEDLVAEESEINVFNRIIEGFSVTLDTDEELAVLTALEPVVHNLGDLPEEKYEIPTMVYGDFVDYIGDHAENVHCKKSYDTLASVSEIVESDLDELGWSLSNDTIMTLAIIETLYTAVERASGQVWDECQMAASSSNIPDRETVEQVEMPKSGEQMVEKIPEDQVEVITEDSTTSTKSQGKTEEPNKTTETHNESKTSDNDEDIDVLGILGITEEELHKMSVDDIMALPGVQTLINMKLLDMNGAEENLSGTTKKLMVEFVTSAVRDLMCVLKCEDPTKRIEETAQSKHNTNSGDVYPPVQEKYRKYVVGTGNGVNAEPTTSQKDNQSHIRSAISGIGTMMSKQFGI